MSRHFALNKWSINMVTNLALLFFTAAGSYSLLPAQALSQSLDQELSASFNALGLQAPVAVALSPSGTRLAFADRVSELIHVTNLDGELLWSSTVENRVGNISALCFLTERELLFASQGKASIGLISEYEPSEQSVAAVLSGEFNDKSSIAQIVRRLENGYLILDDNLGQIVSVNAGFVESQIIIAHGSGPGRIGAPSGIGIFADGSLAISDRASLPLQIFSPDGEHVTHGGWNEPQLGRGWVASAVAIDSRNRIWCSDETNSQFRLFDQAGIELRTFPFEIVTSRIVALQGIATNHMIALEKSGAIKVYTLE